MKLKAKVKPYTQRYFEEELGFEPEAAVVLSKNWGQKTRTFEEINRAVKAERESRELSARQALGLKTESKE